MKLNPNYVKALCIRVVLDHRPLNVDTRVKLIQKMDLEFRRYKGVQSRKTLKNFLKRSTRLWISRILKQT